MICTAEATGLDVEISDPTIPAGLRAALIPWRQVGQLVADAATPGRLEALATALAADDPSASQAAADAIVLGGPAVTQLDLLDALATLGDQTQPEQRQGKPRRTRRPSRTTTTGADSTGAPESGVLGAAGCVAAGAGCLAQVMPLPGSQRVPSMSNKAAA